MLIVKLYFLVGVLDDEWIVIKYYVFFKIEIRYLVYDKLILVKKSNIN